MSHADWSRSDDWRLHIPTHTADSACKFITEARYRHEVSNYIAASGCFPPVFPFTVELRSFGLFLV